MNLSSDGEFWFRLWSVVVTGVVIILFILTSYTYKEEKLFMENGYEQVVLPGSNTYRWQKVRGECID